MKEVRKIILGFLFLISLNLISAYTKSSSYFGFSGFFSDFRTYIPFAIAFLIIFYAFNFVLNKMKMKNSWIIALILSIFSIYGLYISEINLGGFLSRIGFTEDFLFKFGPWILLALIALIVWKWNFGILLMISGIILIVLRIAKVSDYELALFLGTLLLLFGLALHRKINRRKAYKSMNLKDREDYKIKRGSRRDAQAQKWNNAGRRIGHGLAWTGSKFKGSKTKKEKFQFRRGMRRGGQTKRRSRFVGKDLVNRYSNIYGSRAAKRRFNQYKT
jgi:hypothetical protein